MKRAKSRLIDASLVQQLASLCDRLLPPGSPAYYEWFKTFGGGPEDPLHGDNDWVVSQARWLLAVHENEVVAALKKIAR